MDKDRSRPTILIVDDVPENLQVLGELLQPTYMIKVATSGERALKIAGTAPHPDLILLDVMMPVMDGYECLRRLRDNPATRDIPVIFITALDSTEDERKGLDMGVVDYITKPIRPAIVEARIRNHLDIKSARDWLLDQNAFLEAELNRLLEILAHHLQEPVRRQFTFAQLLRRSLSTPLNESAEQSLSQILTGAAHLRAMLHDMLLYLAACQGPTPATPCQADQALKAALFNLSGRLTLADAHLETGDMPTVWISPDQLVAVFRALLSNAVEYRSPNRPLHISIQAHQEGDRQVFSITDNGLGIPSDLRDRAFWIFERLHNDPAHPGTGLGLALARKIVEARKGQIWIDDGMDGGCKVCFSLPCRAE